MKYTVKINIDKPIDKVVELFDNADNLKKWMPELESYEHLSGEPGKPGAKASMVFQHKNRKTQMIETIIKNELPGEFSGTYEATGIWNIQKNTFKEIDENTTQWISEAEFRFSGLMMKLIGIFMPGAFKKQSMRFLEQFKEFAEHED